MARARMAHLLWLFSNLCLSSLEKYSRRFWKIWGDIAVDLENVWADSHFCFEYGSPRRLF